MTGSVSWRMAARTASTMASVEGGGRCVDTGRSDNHDRRYTSGRLRWPSQVGVLSSNE